MNWDILGLTIIVLLLIEACRQFKRDFGCNITDFMNYQNEKKIWDDFFNKLKGEK